MSIAKFIIYFLNNIYNNKRLLLVCIFFLSLLASLIFLIFLGHVGPSEHNVPGTDYLTFYEPVANNILQGKGITIEGEIGLRYPPGYPVILAVIFWLANLLGIGELGLIVIFNSIITAGTTCLLFLIAESIFNRKIALISSFLWLSYPFNLWFLKNPNSEVPFIFLLYMGIWFFLLALNKKSFWFILFSGLLLSFASLVRPIGLLFPFLLAFSVFFLLKESSKKLCFLLAFTMLFGSLMAIMPWETHVFSSTSKIIPISTNGSMAIVDGLSFSLNSEIGGDRISVPADVLALMERAGSGELTTVAKTFDFLIEELIKRPVTLSKVVGLKLTRSWYATSQMWWEGKILLIQLFYLLTGLLGLRYAIKNNKDKLREIMLFLVIILFFWGMTCVALSILRYMVPIMGIVIVFSAITVAFVIDKINCFLKIKSKTNV
ncbi:MAG: glycosyltransferase family 39 protein [Candidatus Nealsonbacteria bacterium]